MITLINLNINKYKENGKEYYVATSDDVQGLVAEEKTLDKVIDLAKKIAKDLIDLQKENNKVIFQKIPSSIKYPLILKA